MTHDTPYKDHEWAGLGPDHHVRGSEYDLLDFKVEREEELISSRICFFLLFVLVFPDL